MLINGAMIVSFQGLNVLSCGFSHSGGEQLQVVMI